MKQRLKGLLQLMQQSKNFTKLYKKAFILLKSHLKTPKLHAFSHKNTLKYILKKWETNPDKPTEPSTPDEPTPEPSTPDEPDEPKNEGNIFTKIIDFFKNLINKILSIFKW